MHSTKPQVFLIGETKLIPEQVEAYLQSINAPDWQTKNANSHTIPSNSEVIIEIMGRLCYRSFAPNLNPNVTKVREGNDAYLANIIKSRHGSVIEHAVLNFIFANVSRVFTHELVRHRVGTAISQESLRFVRLNDLGLWIPPGIEGNQEAISIFTKTFEELERLQHELAELFNLDNPTTNFAHKKKLTSAMRRLAPIGLSTSIGWSANFRTLRQVIVQRTSHHAEEEIRFVFGKIAEIIIPRYPNLFADFTMKIIHGLPEYTTEFDKI